LKANSRVFKRVLEISRNNCQISKQKNECRP
jgi:hypothetical protein